MKIRSQAKRRGFMLFESLIAMTIFSIIITGIVLALTTSSDIVRNVERENWVQRQLEMVLMETLKQEQSKDEFLEEKVISLDEFGAEAKVIVTPSELEDQDGAVLQDFYDISITINWKDETGEDKNETLETYQYWGLYTNRR